MPVEVNSSEQGPGNTYLVSAACPLRVYQVNTRCALFLYPPCASLEVLLVFIMSSALQDTHEQGVQFCSCKQLRDIRPLVKDYKIRLYKIENHTL